MAGTTEEYRDAVTLGKRVPHDGPIVLEPYDPAWPSQFATLARKVHGALGEKVVLLEHVGSTSIPGLCAKPIIDMVLAVADSNDDAAYVPALEAAGFQLWIREPDWLAHRLLKAPEIAANLHVFSAGCQEIGRMLRFRDWIRAHGDERRAYEERKRELAARRWKHVQDYADAKSGIVEEILARAFSPDARWK
jgi:GrpB-like predicted nucleotidyltransferase (UPF0157 family)